MGGGASKTKEDRFVDRVVVAGGERVDCVKLRPDATLADARHVIEEDRDDPEYPQPGIPKRFVFDRQGVRVPPRREVDWAVQDALAEGEHLLIVDAEAQGVGAEKAGAKKSVEGNSPEKDVAARPPTKTSKTPLSKKAAALGEQAATAQEAVDAVEEAVDAAKTFADDTGLSDLLSSAFGIVDTVSDAVPGSDTVPSFSQAKHFTLIDADLNVENGLLTPTLKIRRTATTKKFSVEIDSLYQSIEARGGDDHSLRDL